MQVGQGGVDLSAQVTAFLITTGEITEGGVREALGAQDCIFNLEIISNVAPMSAAFQAMVDRCKTPFLIQVDSDMILKRHAVRWLYERMVKLGTNVFMLAAPLWDDHLDRVIVGVKIYRHGLMMLATYRDVQSCEVDHIQQLEKFGFKYVVAGWDDETDCNTNHVLGWHGTSYDQRGAYERYFDLAEKMRHVPGNEWFADHIPRLLDRVREGSQRTEDIWGLIGAIAGLTSLTSISRGEKDYKSLPPGYAQAASRIASDPREAVIYTTDKCNAKCTFCRRQFSGKQHLPDFDVKMAKRLLQEFPGISSACLAGFGEPTCSPTIAPVIEYMREAGVYCGLITNGLCDESAHHAFSLCSHITISLNAENAEDHERVFGVKGGFARALKTVGDVSDGDVPVLLSFVIDNSTFSRIPAYLHLVKNSGAAGAIFVNLLPHHNVHDAQANADFLSRVLRETPENILRLEEYKHMALALGVVVGAWPVFVGDIENPPCFVRAPFRE